MNNGNGELYVRQGIRGRWSYDARDLAQLDCWGRIAKPVVPKQHLLVSTAEMDWQGAEDRVNNVRSCRTDCRCTWSRGKL